MLCQIISKQGSGSVSNPVQIIGYCIRPGLWQYGGMPKRISKKLTDTNEIAFQVVQAATSESSELDAATLSKVMAQMGRKGGKIGGKRSMETMTPAERKRRAKKAAQSRWQKPTK